MKLKTKVLYLLFTVFALYLVADYTIQRSVVYPSFLALEREEGIKDLQRVQEAITREKEHLSTLCYDWAAWDATYKYIEDRNEEYASENLILESFTETRLNLIYFINTKGEVVWGEIRDLDTEELMELKMFPPNRFPEDYRLFKYETVKSSNDGLVITERGPMLITSRPILTSESKGPIRGTILMGRLLTQDIVKILKEQTRVDFQIWPINSEVIPPEDRLAVDNISPTTGFFMQERSDDLLAVYSTYSDINGNPGLLMRANISRDISARGADAMHATVLSMLAAGVITLLILVLAIQRTVVGPISRLTTQTTAIGTSRDLTAVINLKRKDEIGILANEFDKMLAKLAKQTAQLEKTNQAKSEFLASMSHEIRTPLNHIIGFTEIVVDNQIGELNKQQKEFLNDVLDSGRHLLQLINDILDFSRVEAGKLQLELSEIDLHSLLTTSFNIIKEKAINQDIKLKTSINGIPETVWLDKRKIKQILYNLLSNAAKFTPKSGQIKLSARSIKGVVHSGKRRTESKEIKIFEQVPEKNNGDQGFIGNCIEFSVSDSGIGIKNEDKSRIFNAFEQVSNSNTRSYKGTGLGLPLTKKMVELHDGIIWVESDGENRGSTFKFIIPIYEDRV